jgi:hypothetical protein
MTTIPPHELTPGGVVAYNGGSLRITCIDRRAGWAWPIATDDTGRAIALGRQLVTVDRDAA